MATETKRLNMRLTSELLRKIEKEARLQKFDKSALIRKILDQYIVSQEMRRGYGTKP